MADLVLCPYSWMKADCTRFDKDDGITLLKHYHELSAYTSMLPLTVAATKPVVPLASFNIKKASIKRIRKAARRALLLVLPFPDPNWQSKDWLVIPCEELQSGRPRDPAKEQ